LTYSTFSHRRGGKRKPGSSQRLTALEIDYDTNHGLGSACSGAVAVEKHSVLIVFFLVTLLYRAATRSFCRLSDKRGGGGERRDGHGDLFQPFWRDRIVKKHHPRWDFYFE
jgi:hypothetical protein